MFPYGERLSLVTTVLVVGFLLNSPGFCNAYSGNYEAPLYYREQALNGTDLPCGVTQFVNEGETYIFDSASAVIYESSYPPPNNQHYRIRRKRGISKNTAKEGGSSIQQRSYGGYNNNGGYRGGYGNGNPVPSVCQWSFASLSSCSLEMHIIRFKPGDLNCYKQSLIISDNTTQFKLCGNQKLFPGFRSETEELYVKYSRLPYIYRHVFKGFVTCVPRTQRPAYEDSYQYYTPEAHSLFSGNQAAENTQSEQHTASAQEISFAGDSVSSFIAQAGLSMKHESQVEEVLPDEVSPQESDKVQDSEKIFEQGHGDSQVLTSEQKVDEVELENEGSQQAENEQKDEKLVNKEGQEEIKKDKTRSEVRVDLNTLLSQHNREVKVQKEVSKTDQKTETRKDLDSLLSEHNRNPQQGLHTDKEQEKVSKLDALLAQSSRGEGLKEENKQEIESNQDKQEQEVLAEESEVKEEVKLVDKAEENFMSADALLKQMGSFQHDLSNQQASASETETEGQSEVKSDDEAANKEVEEILPQEVENSEGKAETEEGEALPNPAGSTPAVAGRSYEDVAVESPNYSPLNYNPPPVGPYPPGLLNFNDYTLAYPQYSSPYPFMYPSGLVADVPSNLGSPYGVPNNQPGVYVYPEMMTPAPPLYNNVPSPSLQIPNPPGPSYSNPPMEAYFPTPIVPVAQPPVSNPNQPEYMYPPATSFPLSQTPPGVYGQVPSTGFLYSSIAQSPTNPPPGYPQAVNSPYPPNIQPPQPYPPTDYISGYSNTPAPVIPNPLYSQFTLPDVQYGKIEAPPVAIDRSSFYLASSVEAPTFNPMYIEPSHFGPVIAPDNELEQAQEGTSPPYMGLPPTNPLAPPPVEIQFAPSTYPPQGYPATSTPPSFSLPNQPSSAPGQGGSGYRYLMTSASNPNENYLVECQLPAPNPCIPINIFPVNSVPSPEPPTQAPPAYFQPSPYAPVPALPKQQSS